MTVYIEYAFLQNFLLDGVLLWLSRKVTRLPVSIPRLLLSAGVGGIVALLFPLLRLSVPLAALCKLACGCLVTLMLFRRVKTRKEWGRYALNTLSFFLLTFLFGGALLGGVLPDPKRGIGIWTCFAALALLVYILAEKFYKKGQIERRIYPCKVFLGEKTVKLRGFYDSGNLATKNGLPVCFLSADILYDLVGNEIVFGKATGQVCDEMRISTLSGESRVPLYRGFLEVKTPTENAEKKEVYFALARNMIERDYKIILNGEVV